MTLTAHPTLIIAADGTDVVDRLRAGVTGFTESLRLDFDSS